MWVIMKSVFVDDAYLFCVQKQTKNEPEMGQVFVSSLEQLLRSSFRYDARSRHDRHTACRGICDIRNVVPLPRVTMKKDNRGGITPEGMRLKVSNIHERYMLTSR